MNLIVEHNVIACNALTLEGLNGLTMKIMLKPVKRTTVLTVPHSQERIELLSQAKTHGNIFAATGGVHLTANDIFKGIVLKQRKITCEKLAREKTVRERQEKTEANAKIIQAGKGKDDKTYLGRLGHPSHLVSACQRCQDEEAREAGCVGGHRQQWESASGLRAMDRG